MQLADEYMHAVYVRNVTIIFCFCYIGACGKANVDDQDDGWSVGMWGGIETAVGIRLYVD